MDFLKNKWVWVIGALVVASVIEYRTQWFTAQINKLKAGGAK